MTCWQPSKRIAALRLPRKSHHRLEIVTLCHCVSMGFVSKVVRGMYIHCGHAKVVWVTAGSRAAWVPSCGVTSVVGEDREERGPRWLMFKLARHHHLYLLVV